MSTIQNEPPIAEESNVVRLSSYRLQKLLSERESDFYNTDFDFDFVSDPDKDAAIEALLLPLEANDNFPSFEQMLEEDKFSITFSNPQGKSWEISFED